MRTLQCVIDNYMGYPKLIYRRNGKVAIRNSKSMIEKGQVLLNERVCSETEKIVVTGDYIRWGFKHRRYHPLKESMSVP